MTCTTFLHSWELNVPTTNDVINSLLAEIREETGRDYQVIEREYHHAKRWWKKVQPPSKFYELYAYVGGMGPWQAINFYREKSATSINLRCDADMLVAHFYGILTGIHNMKFKNV